MLVISVLFGAVTMGCFRYADMSSGVETVLGTGVGMVIDHLGSTLVISHLVAVAVDSLVPILLAIYLYRGIESARRWRELLATAICTSLAAIILGAVFSTKPFSFSVMTLTYAILVVCAAAWLLSARPTKVEP
jgi:hypothetical protein